MKLEDIGRGHDVSRNEVRKLRKELEESVESNDRFFKTLERITSQIDPNEISLKNQDYTSTIRAQEWQNIINILNQKLSICLESCTSQSMIFPPEVAPQVEVILNFCLRFFHVTRRQTHDAFVNNVAHLLKADDWDVVVKVLRIMADYSTRNKGTKGLPQDEAKKEEAIQWLLNIALGFNLKTSAKVSSLAMLEKPQKELSFQYYSEKEGDEVPSIRTIELSHLAGNTKPSYELAEEIAKSAELPKFLFPALWCKIRTAKIQPSDYSGHYKIVLAELLAFHQVPDEVKLKNFFTETELKTRLVSDLIELLKYTKESTELHTLILEIFTAIVPLKGVIRTYLGNMASAFTEELLRDLGVNVSQSGFIYTILRECTLLQAVKEGENKYKLVVPQRNLEILSSKTATNQEFLVELLYFLYAAYKSLSSSDLNSQEAARFWLGVQTALINILQVPFDERCYVYPVPVLILATQLLLLLSINQNVEHDVSNVDAILLRLSFEISHLEAEKGVLVYPSESSYPKLDQRQNLCRALIHVLVKSIKAGSGERASYADIDELENVDYRRDFILDELGDDLRNDQMNMFIHRIGRQMAGQIRSRGRFGGLGIESVSRRLMRSRLADLEVEEDVEIPQNNEGIALLRRILESKVIELLNEIFQDLAIKGSSKITKAYQPIMYPAITLIATILKNNPASIPSMVGRGIVSNILKLYSKDILPGENSFCTMLYSLASFVLHEEGAAQVAAEKVLTNIFYTLIDPNHKNAISEKKWSNNIRNCVSDIKFIHSQAAPTTKTELAQAITDLFSKVHTDCIEVIKKTAKNPAEVNCDLYAKLLNNIVAILYYLIAKNLRNIKQFLISLNKKNIILKAILTIGKIEPLLKKISPNRFTEKEDTYANTIIEFYLGDNMTEEPGSGLAEGIVSTTLLKSAKALGSLLELDKKDSSLGDFILKKKTFNPAGDEIIDAFPDSEKLSIAFSIVKWICKSVGVFGRISSPNTEALFQFINSMQLLISKELMRLCLQNIETENIIQEKLITLLKAEYDNLKKPESESQLGFISSLVLTKPDANYEKTIWSIYNDLRNSLPNIIKPITGRGRSSDYDTRSVNPTIFQTMCKCAVRLLMEAVSSDLKSLSTTKEDLLASELKVMHIILLLNDARKILLENNAMGPLVFELSKTDGLNKLHELYQQTVYLIVGLKPQANDVLLEALKVLLSYIMKIYCNIMDVSQLAQAIKTISVQVSSSELSKEGYNSIDTFISSILVYTVEGLLFQTKYGEYKTAIRFLAECVPCAFNMLLSVLESYPKKNLLMEIFRHSRSSHSNPYMDMIYRRGQEIPTYMLEQLLTMGFNQTESEEALRRHNLDLDNAVTELISLSEQRVQVQRTEVPHKATLKKVDSKAMPKMINDWLEYLTVALYESIYSISSYPCKYLLYTLSEYQSENRTYKVVDAFALLLNELQTLLFSIELTYEFTLIPNENFPVSELAEVPMTEKFMKRVKKYTAESGATEQELTVLHKMSALIDIITTFLRLSSTKQLLKMMCENKISQCLIVVLSKIVQKDLILQGRKLLPKALVLLGMIYKEVHSILQGANYKAILMENSADEIPREAAQDLLPNQTDTKKLLEILNSIIDMDADVTAKLTKMKKSEDKKPCALVTTEILTAIILLLTYMTKDYSNTELVFKSEILQRILSIKQIQGARIAIPSGLFKKLIFNVLESPALLETYMKRVIAGILFAKTKYRENGMQEPKDEAELKALQKESGIELDRFLKSTDFLIVRNIHCFVESCRKVAILQKELNKDSAGKTTARHNLVLNEEYLKRMVKEASVNIPRAKLNRKKESVMDTNEYNYAVLLHNSFHENMEKIKTTNPTVIELILSRLVNLQFESKENNDYVIPKAFLLELLSQIIRIYPETSALLLSYVKSSQPAINGNKLISFLITTLLPQQCITSDKKLQVDLQWKNSIVALMKAMTYYNPHLNFLRHRLMSIEATKRIIFEVFYVLLKNTSDKSKSTEILAQTYISFIILEGLLVTSENTVINPQFNQYQILAEMTYQNKNMINIMTEILKKCNFFSNEIETLLNPITNVLEWITRLNKLAGEEKITVEKEFDEVPSKKFVSEIYAEEYNDVQPMEIDTEELKSDPNDEYVAEEEIKLQPKESAAPDVQRDPMVYSMFRDNDEDSDENADEYLPWDVLRRNPHDHESVERHNTNSRQQRDELDSVQVQINAEPIDKDSQGKNGLYNIYNTDNDTNTNEQIVNIMRGEVLGEEIHLHSEMGDRRFRHAPELFDSERHVWRINQFEEEDMRQDKLPAISLFGDTVDKKKSEEILKNQLLGALKTETIVIEEKKPEVKKEEPEAAVQSESKEENKSKAPEAKEEKKTEQSMMSPAALANLITSIISGNAPPPEEQKVEEKKQEEKKEGVIYENVKEPESKEEIKKEPENKEEEKKQEDNKEEEKKEESKEEKKEEGKEESKEEVKQQDPAIIQALIAQRRQELEQLVPNIRVEDDNILLQIDFGFLRALTPELRRQSIQHLLSESRTQEPPQENPGQGPADLDPATFVASIMDDNLRDEILLTATPEFLAALPPDMASRAEHLQQRNYINAEVFARRERNNDEEYKQQAVPPNSIEALVIVNDKETEERKQLAQKIFLQIGRITEDSFEALIKLLYLNTNKKIPLNTLLSNLCYSKKNMYKLLNTLLFILSKHTLYEKYFSSKASSKTLFNCISETKLTDSYFPPVYLYRGTQFNHLIYSIVSLRIFSLLSSLLNKPQAVNFFFMPCTEVSTDFFNLTSVTSLRNKLSIEPTKSPFEELLTLTKDSVYTSSEKHLEAVINFINNLFNTAEHLAVKREDSKKIMLSVMSVENVKQVCQIFYLEGMNDDTFNKVTEILLKLSQLEENMYAIMEEIQHLVDVVSATAIKEWSREIAQLNTATETIANKNPEEELQKNSRTEIKMDRVLQLIKRLFDGHKISTDSSPNKFVGIYVIEGDAIEDIIPSPKKVQRTASEEKVDQTRAHLALILRKDILIEAFNVLTELLSIISKKASGENNSRKSQLLTKLMPAIESLIIAYDYCLRDPHEADKLLTQLKEIWKATPEEMKELSQKYKIAFVFYKFIEKNHSAFNNLIRQMPYNTFRTMVKPFIVRFPNLLDFENKRNYFRREQEQIKRHSMVPLRITVSRESIFTDSYNQLAALPVADLKGRIKVTLKDEEAADVGGVTREWYTTLSKAMFNPIIGLFKKSAHGNTYQPDPNSVVEPHHLNYFKFIGRIIGKALLDGQYLECYFTRALYKILVGQPLTIQDMQDYDPELYKSLQWIRDNDVTDLDSTFTYTIDYFGRLEVRELIEDGKNVKVTNENKHQFIVKMCKALLQDAIRPQIEALQKGLYEIIPKNLISIFDSKEIELMISGLPDIDLLDLRRNTEYHGYTENSEVIIWLWEVMETFSAKERAEFLQFVTGTSKVPLDGFKNLPGASGIQKFQIHRVYGEADRLPTAHTCFNQLDLPTYPSKEILHERLLKAIKEGADFMGLV